MQIRTKDVEDTVLTFGYQLPMHLTQIDSFTKLKQLAQCSCIPKQPRLRVDAIQGAWKEELQIIPDNFHKLPLDMTTGIISSTNELIELESINPLLTLFILKQFNSILKSIIETPINDGSAISSPWNSLNILGNFLSIEIVQLFYESNSATYQAIDACSNDINNYKDLLRFGPNIAVIIIMHLIKKDALKELVKRLFPKEMSVADFIDADRLIGPILFHRLLCTTYKSEIDIVANYLACKTNTLLTFDQLLSAMNSYGPILRAHTCRDNQQLITNEDQFYTILSALRTPSSVTGHFIDHLLPHLNKFNLCLIATKLMHRCYGLTNSQILDAGIYANRGEGNKMGCNTYLKLVNARVKSGLVNSIEESITLISKQQQAKSSNNIELDTKLMSDLEHNLLSYLIKKCKSADDALPNCVMKINNYKIFEDNQTLYKELQLLISTKLTLKQRCIDVICLPRNYPSFFSNATESLPAWLPEIISCHLAF